MYPRASESIDGFGPKLEDGFRNTAYTLNGNHGYDFRFNSMHALFIGYGPSFKRNYSAEPFQNIEIFELVSGNAILILKVS
jgi:hypothetical protein